MSLRFGPTSKTALDTLKEQGLVPPDKPTYDMPSLPHELTSVNDDDLMVLYAELTAYADFVAVQVSCAQVDERALEKMLSSVENKKMLASDGKTENRVTFARAQVAADPEVIAIKDRLEETHAYRKLIEVLMSNIERDTGLISREITRRTASGGSHRSNRWSA